MTERKKFTYIIIALFITLLVAYCNHFENDFHFDDFHTIVNNGAIRKLSNIPRFFVDATLFSTSPNHQGLRPMVTTTLAIDYYLGNGLMLFWFHLSIFLWHIGLCILLFFLYKKLLGTFIHHRWVKYFALFAAAWFGIHTAGAETINYIISRSDVLSTFFIVLSLYIYVAYPKKRKSYLYIIPAVAGIFAKETVPVLVILLFFYILLFEKNLSIADIFKKANFKILWQTFLQLLPIILVIIFVQLYTLSRMKAQSASFGMSNPYGYYWLTQTYVWFLYFKSFFLPTHLSADTDLAVIKTIWDTRILTGIIFLALYIYTIFKTSVRKETRPIAFGLIWFGASLLPTSLAPFAEVMNDHRMYFAFTGLSLSVVTTISFWLIKNENYFMLTKMRKVLLLSAAFLVIFLNAYGVFQRNKVWRTEETLWYDVTQKSPLNGRGWMNYGLTQMAKGNNEVALENFKQAQELLPAYNLIYVNLGIVSGELKKQTDADNYFKAAISLSPNDAMSYSYYARYLVENGKINDAKIIAEKALAINPVDDVALNAQMAVLQSLQLWDELEKAANHKLAIFPNDVEALKYLATAKIKAPNNKKIGDIKLNTTPATEDDYINLSLAMYNIGKFNECIEACENAIKLNPKSADAYSNMCAAYNSLQQWDKAKEACAKALSINPEHKLAKGNMQWAITGKN